MKSIKSFALAILVLVIMFTAVPLTAAKGDKAPSDQSIVAIAASNPEFSTLVSLVQFAELDGVLANEGQFTVFAPTNAAFDALIAALITEYGEETTNALLSDKAFITDVLLYHVTDGRRFSNSLFNGNNSKTVEMLNGGYIWTNPNVTITDGSSLTGDAGIVAANISASNGVIHVIDSVMVP
jgi:uncharacterized surface protein with fasciclin (FAS1) repeats